MNAMLGKPARLPAVLLICLVFLLAPLLSAQSDLAETCRALLEQTKRLNASNATANVTVEVNLPANLSNGTGPEPVFVLSQEASVANFSLVRAQAQVAEMQAAGMPTARVGDLLLDAQQTFDAQLALERDGGRPDYRRVLDASREINRVRNLAAEALDELTALNQSLAGLDPQLNASAARATYAVAWTDYREERYEDARVKVNDAYSQIAEAEAKQSMLGALYDSASRTIGAFLEKNKYYLLGLAVALGLVLLIGRRQIERYLLYRELKHLILERQVLMEMMKRTQKEYFESKQLPETAFQIRMRKFGELIKDIDRRIPLIQEQLVKRGEKFRLDRETGYGAAKAAEIKK